MQKFLKTTMLICAVGIWILAAISLIGVVVSAAFLLYTAALFLGGCVYLAIWFILSKLEEYDGNIVRMFSMLGGIEKAQQAANAANAPPAPAPVQVSAAPPSATPVQAQVPGDNGRGYVEAGPGQIQCAACGKVQHEDRSVCWSCGNPFYHGDQPEQSASPPETPAPEAEVSAPETEAPISAAEAPAPVAEAPASEAEAPTPVAPAPKAPAPKRLFCPYCGAENRDTANFCRNCGRKLPTSPENPV